MNAKDLDYDIKDITFTGYVYKLNTPPFNVVKRSAHAKGANYMEETVEYHGQNVFTPTSGMCFIKCNIYFTNKDYTEEFRDFIRSEKKRSGIMTFTGVQLFCEKYDNSIGCFDGKRTNPRNITERNISLFI